MFIIHKNVACCSHSQYYYIALYLGSQLFIKILAINIVDFNTETVHLAYILFLAIYIRHLSQTCVSPIHFTIGLLPQDCL